MLRLTILTGARAGARVDLSQPIVRIGRAPDNDLAFDPNSDLDASGHHAEIRGEQGRYVLHDLQSRNGIFLPMLGMGRILQPYPLAQQDQIQLGPAGPRVQIEIFGPPPAEAPQYAAQATAPAGPPMGYGPTGYVQAAPAAGPPPIVPPMAAPVPPPNPGGGGKPMGQQTLLAHVGAMLQQQQQQQQPKRGKSTMEIKALIDTNVQKETGKLRTVIGLLVGVIVVISVVVAIVALRPPGDPRKQADALNKELAECQKKNPDSPEKCKELEDKVAKVTAGDNTGKNIYEKNREAIFMLVGHKSKKSYDKGGFCTGFSIEKRVVATNAHCVKAALAMEAKGLDIWVHQNESAKGGDHPKMWKVVSKKGHPKYDHNGMSITPDVGKFVVEDDLPVQVSLASEDELKKLSTGENLYVIGFPGRTMEESSPVATFMFSHVGRITDKHGAQADSFKDGWLVQHEGQTTPGTSGSPIFNQSGKVVAINAGGLLEKNQQAVYKYAMRIDLLDKVKVKGSSASSDDDDDDGDKKKKKKGDDDDD
ncbi:MAG: trypsin-like peptidase domain-containing protein [Myxococcales bacterium]|nr:trypsin-like peptidase domain-containing protein [Myxococcales bacterium]